MEIYWVNIHGTIESRLLLDKTDCINRPNYTYDSIKFFLKKYKDLFSKEEHCFLTELNESRESSNMLMVYQIISAKDG